MLGFQNVRRYIGGIEGWESDGREEEVVSRGTIDVEVAGGAVVVDLRSKAEYDAGHLDGAVNLSPAELIADPAGALSGVSFETTVILYGAGGRKADESAAAAAVSEAGFTRVLYYTPGFTFGV